MGAPVERRILFNHGDLSILGCVLELIFSIAASFAANFSCPSMPTYPGTYSNARHIVVRRGFASKFSEIQSNANFVHHLRPIFGQSVVFNTDEFNTCETKYCGTDTRRVF